MEWAVLPAVDCRAFPYLAAVVSHASCMSAFGAFRVVTFVEALARPRLSAAYLAVVVVPVGAHSGMCYAAPVFSDVEVAVPLR